MKQLKRKKAAAFLCKLVLKKKKKEWKSIYEPKARVFYASLISLASLLPFLDPFPNQSKSKPHSNEAWWQF